MMKILQLTIISTLILLGNLWSQDNPAPVWELGKNVIASQTVTGNVELQDGVLKLDCLNSFTLPENLLSDQQNFTIEFDFRCSPDFQPLSRMKGAISLLSNGDLKNKTGITLTYFPEKWDMNGGVSNRFGYTINGQWQPETRVRLKNKFTNYKIVVKNETGYFFQDDLLIQFLGTINPGKEPFRIGGPGRRNYSRPFTKEPEAIPEPYELSNLKIYNQAIMPYKKSKYWGKYPRHDFVVDNCAAILVEPVKPLPGNPWIWRAEFFNAFAGVDLALLAKGYHLAFINVGTTSYGCPEAMAHWDKFYQEMTGKYNLSTKPVLEGLSRGGLYIYNWSAKNTDKVSCLFGDAPVCDFKSWPGVENKGLLQRYNFKTKEEALAYKGNPVDNLKPLADAGIPIIHIYGDVDKVVPPAENTLVIKERYTKLGGNIVTIPKPGIGHHPHGLKDPTPVVDFILKHTAK